MSLNKSQALNVAKQYVLQRNVRAAIDIYREIIEADPTDFTAINTLGDLYASTGLVHEAIAQFSRVADSYIESGFTRKAIATLKKIIAADPANTATAIKLADMYAKAGLPSEARQHYLRIANVYTRNGETLEALRIFTRIGDLDPSNPSTRIKLGELYLCEGMNEQAYEAFVTAAEQLISKGEIRRALNAYNEALSIRPDSIDALEAAHKLAKTLGVADVDKVRRRAESQSAASGDLNEEKASITTSDLPRTPTPLYPGLETDDLFVVQEISMAERMVALGQVNQAILMLKSVLTNKPDNIDVHIKLKDICLRTGMMTEAAQECSELARIHQARGEDDRARDYTVRANRLTQLIERSSGDLQQPKRKPVDDTEPRVNAAPVKLAPPCEPHPQVRQITGQLDAEQAQPSRITLSVVPPAAIASEANEACEQPAPADVQAVYQPAAIIAADLPPVLRSDDVEHPPSFSETNLEAESSLESAIDQATSSSTDAIGRIMPSLSSGTLRVERNRDRLRAAAIAATVFVLGLVGTMIGGSAYNAHLDKQFETLALAAPRIDDPSSPPTPVSDTEPIEENEPIVVNVTASLQAETPPRLQKPEPEVIRNVQPAPSQPASEPPKVVTRASLLPPQISVSPGSQADTENRTPAGLAGEVPATPTHPAEPPPKAVRRSAGVVPGIAFIKPDPVYPQAAREARQVGAVTVEVAISEQGNVTSARAISGPSLLRNAAVSAARGWRFKPSLLGGVPVATTSTITFNFKL